MLEITFWDVQHGSASYIKTPNNTHIVHDLGTGAYGKNQADFSPLLHLKNKYGVTKLDYVIITHPHRDHIDDIFNFYELHPATFLRPKHLTEEEIRQGNQPGDDEHIDKYLEINSDYCHPIPAGTSPTDQENNGGVNIQSFHPTSCSTSNLNNHSIVTIIEHATIKVLITGDNEPPSWNELLEKHSFRTAISGTDILLAPHHGRESAFHRDLFDYITPKLTIISDGPSDSSAVSKYGEVTTGWEVHRRSGGLVKRKCVTTRSDGVIVVKIGRNYNNKPYLAVYID